MEVASAAHAEAPDLCRRIPLLRLIQVLDALPFSLAEAVAIVHENKSGPGEVHVACAVLSLVEKQRKVVGTAVGESDGKPVGSSVG